MHNHAESADLRQTTKIVIAGDSGRACVQDELGETLLSQRIVIKTSEGNDGACEACEEGKKERKGGG